MTTAKHTLSRGDEYTIEEFSGASTSMRTITYQGEVEGQFFPELLVHHKPSLILI
jgi:hypothetical protein